MRLIYKIPLKYVKNIPIDARYIFVQSQGYLKVYKIIHQ
jgi:hypothetical protein